MISQPPDIRHRVFHSIKLHGYRLIILDRCRRIHPNVTGLRYCDSWVASIHFFCRTGVYFLLHSSQCFECIFYGLVYVQKMPHIVNSWELSKQECLYQNVPTSCGAGPMFCRCLVFADQFQALCFLLKWQTVSELLSVDSVMIQCSAACHLYLHYYLSYLTEASSQSTDIWTGRIEIIILVVVNNCSSSE